MGKKILYRFENSTKSTTLATDAIMASSWISRLRGLLFTKEIKQGEGLFLSPCNSIHMFGMIYSIDAVFVDKSNTVVGLDRKIRPMMMSTIYFKAESCIELPAGTIDSTRTEIGDQISLHLV